MQLFRCDRCAQRLFFDNTHCVNCGAAQGFDAQGLRMRVLTDAEAEGWRPCQHYQHEGVCNWLVAPDSDSPFCPACSLNLIIPDLSVPGNRQLWARLEAQKRRLLYSLLRLGIAPLSRQEDPIHGLGFRFLADGPASEVERVMTGHDNGVITLNIAEADPVVRETTRHQMAEPYRTLLGHFRHESGHYYWQRWIADSDWLTDFRRIFGDETQDYAEALQRFYRDGPQGNWQQHCISAYASAHPWEDWAESWAHYLHILDTLNTAYHSGLTVQAERPPVELDIDPYQSPDFEPLIAQWLPLTTVLNSLNRSMGYDDLYPFQLSNVALAKLTFLHRVVQSARQSNHRL